MRVIGRSLVLEYWEDHPPSSFKNFLAYAGCAYNLPQFRLRSRNVNSSVSIIYPSSLLINSKGRIERTPTAFRKDDLNPTCSVVVNVHVPYLFE